MLVNTDTSRQCRGAARTTPPDADPAERVRIAVVGYGYWGSKHVRVLGNLPGVEVTVVDRDGSRRRAAAAEPGVSVARELDDVLARVDAVVVASPPGDHAATAASALRAGKHVLVEKPLATSVADAAQLVRAAAASGVTLMVGHTFEYHAAVWKLRDIIDSGELGDIVYFHSERLGLGQYQRDCDVVWDLAPHDISIVSYLLGETPWSVATWAQRHRGPRHADVAYLRLGFRRSAAHGVVHVSWLHPAKVRRLTVVGDRKMAVYDDLAGTERIRVHDTGVDPATPGEATGPAATPVSYRNGDVVAPAVPLDEPLLVQDRHFLHCVRTGQRPATPGEHGVDVVRVLAASDRALAERATVTVTDGSHAPSAGAVLEGAPR